MYPSTTGSPVVRHSRTSSLARSLLLPDRVLINYNDSTDSVLLSNELMVCTSKFVSLCRRFFVFSSLVYCSGFVGFNHVSFSSNSTCIALCIHSLPFIGCPYLKSCFFLFPYLPRCHNYSLLGVIRSSEPEDVRPRNEAHGQSFERPRYR